jgi:hypothetical protein
MSRKLVGLDEVGTYLLGRFDAPPTELDPLDERIFYVGETHGRTRSLYARLKDFGRSAGFFGKQQNGHYAAWDYPLTFPADAAIDRTDCSAVYMAYCHFPGGGLPRAARGVFPVLVEQMLLWQYANVHARFPILNNSGAWQGPDGPPPLELPRPLLDRLRSSESRVLAAGELLDLVAGSRGYKPRGGARWKRDGWSGVYRPVAPGKWLNFGWRDSPGGLCLSLTNAQDEPLHKSETPTSDEKFPDEARELVERFRQQWYQT